jgi:uncharacterized protein (DUF983 family)
MRSSPFSTQIKRAGLGRCPKCGEGKLFRAYLKPVDACSACAEPYGHIRADDGPTWLTILVVGHVVVPITVALALYTDISDMALLAICSLSIFGLTLALLPRAKGMFIAGIWRSGCVGSEK